MTKFIPIDVEKQAVRNLLKHAQDNYVEAMAEVRDARTSFVVAYWDGYIRALETILEMESE